MKILPPKFKHTVRTVNDGLEDRYLFWLIDILSAKRTSICQNGYLFTKKDIYLPNRHWRSALYIKIIFSTMSDAFLPAFLCIQHLLGHGVFVILTIVSPCLAHTKVLQSCWKIGDGWGFFPKNLNRKKKLFLQSLDICGLWECTQVWSLQIRGFQLDPKSFELCQF